MKFDFLTEAKEISAELYALRESFHKDPELGNLEFRTADKIEAFLHDCGIETKRLTETAVLGILYGGKAGKTAALRADMDALPLPEQTGARFSSENPGIMHACGHDIHMTAALGAAKLLSRHKDCLQGSVRFLFQPDEEGFGGAERMIAAGALEHTDMIFGAHVAPDLPLGTIGIRYGKFYAASDNLFITVHGKSAHGATPEKGIDALAAAAKLILLLKVLPDLFPEDRTVVSIGMLQAGTAGNIIAEKAEMCGILRTLGPKLRREIKEMIRSYVDSLSKESGCTVDLVFDESYPGVVNHDSATALAERTARSVFGDDSVSVIREPLMTTEDFGYFTEVVPGAFYHLGAGCDIPLHNNAFLPDRDAAVIGAAMHSSVIWSFLHGEA